MARVRHIAAGEGFAVNEAKSRVLRRGTAQLVTGLVVNDRPGVRRAEVRKLRAILHRAEPKGWSARTATGRPNYPAWLRGKIAFVAMVAPRGRRTTPRGARRPARSRGVTSPSLHAWKETCMIQSSRSLPGTGSGDGQLSGRPGRLPSPGGRSSRIRKEPP